MSIATKVLRDSSPYVVLVQSARFDRYRRPIVVLLVRQTILPRATPTVGPRMRTRSSLLKELALFFIRWTWSRWHLINWATQSDRWHKKGKSLPMHWTEFSGHAQVTIGYDRSL